MVGIEEVFAGPAEVFDGDVSGVACGLGLGADNFVLAVGFIPGGADIDSEVFGCDKGLELGVGAVGEAIADAEGILWTDFHECN